MHSTAVMRRSDQSLTCASMSDTSALVNSACQAEESMSVTLRQLLGWDMLGGGARFGRWTTHAARGMQHAVRFQPTASSH
jgi:hypothetical protein